MPISFQIDIARRIVLTRAYGTLTDEDLINHRQMLKTDTTSDPTFNQSLNFT
jgi:hypothetical protein